MAIEEQVGLFEPHELQLRIDPEYRVEVRDDGRGLVGDSGKARGLVDLLREVGVKQFLPTIARLSRPEADALYEEMSSRFRDPTHYWDLVTVRFEHEARMDSALKKLRGGEGIHSARRVPIRVPANEPVDPLVPETLGDLTDNGIRKQLYLLTTRVRPAWSLETTGGAKVDGAGTRVAVVDWGFFTTHGSLVNAIEKQYNSIDGVDGQVDTGVYISHGTGVAGMVAAERNGAGVQGVAFGARVWAIKAGEAKSDLVGDPFARGIDWARTEASQTGATVVINIQAQRADGDCIEADEPIRTAIQAAAVSRIPVVVPAGNGEFQIDRGDFPDSGGIVVGATDFASTNYGTRVDICAPGRPDDDITCDSVPNGYDHLGGTSGAAAKVAGVLALLRQVQPEWATEDLRDFLRDKGQDWNGFPSPLGKFLDAEMLVSQALP